MMSATRNVRIMIGRELYSYFASPIAYVFLVIFLGICGVFTFQLGAFYESRVASLEASFFSWHPFIFMVFVPAVGMRLWAEERRGGTDELLFTLPTSVWQAVLAKFLGGSIFLAVSLLLTCPIVITVNYLGKPDNGMVFCGYLGSLLVALSFLAISSFTSALTRNQIVSFILGMVLCLLLVLCGLPTITEPLVSWGQYLAGALGGGWLATGAEQLAAVIASLSVLPHFETMQRGVLDSRDLIYYASLITFGLVGTNLVLKNK